VRHLPLISLAALGLAAGFAAPAVAQVAVDEITVYGPRLGPDGRPATLSRVVPISDLDLRNAGDQRILKDRIRATARDICRELGENPDTAAPPLRQSCAERAVASAQNQMRLAIDQAFQPRYAVVTPPDTPYVAPVGETGAAADVSATVPDHDSTLDSSPQAATGVSTDVSATAPAPSYTVTTVTNGGVPDTPANRARYGQPMSNAGKRTSASGN
jgi:UrcA family protein